jgi:hypothetical protein
MKDRQARLMEVLDSRKLRRMASRGAIKLAKKGALRDVGGYERGISDPYGLRMARPGSLRPYHGGYDFPIERPHAAYGVGSGVTGGYDPELPGTAPGQLQSLMQSHPGRTAKVEVIRRRAAIASCRNRRSNDNTHR